MTQRATVSDSAAFIEKILRKKKTPDLLLCLGQLLGANRACPRDSPVPGLLQKHLCCSCGGRKVQVKMFSVLLGREAGIWI